MRCLRGARTLSHNECSCDARISQKLCFNCFPLPLSLCVAHFVRDNLFWRIQSCWECDNAWPGGRVPRAASMPDTRPENHAALVARGGRHSTDTAMPITGPSCSSSAASSALAAATLAASDIAPGGTTPLPARPNIVGTTTVKLGFS